MGCHDKELSILFTDDTGIARLNRQYLGRKGPTNVLAFPMTPSETPPFDSPMLGDIVISTETAQKEATQTGEPIERTIDRLMIHGLLHLLGYDHEASPAEAYRMEKEEERLAAILQP